MAGPIRMQLFFNMTSAGSRAAGWSETYYSATAATLPGALANLQRLAAARVNLLGAGVTLRYMRVSDDSVFRDVRSVPGILPLIGAHGPYYLGTFANSPADFAYSCALVRCQGSSDFYNRSLFLSGIPDLDQDIEHPVPFTAAWLAQFLAFKSLLESGPYGFKVQNRDGAHAEIQITGLAAGIFTTAANHGFNVNDQVRIRGFLPRSGQNALGNPNGLWRVQATPALNTFALLGYAQLTFVPTTLGRVRKVEYTVSPIITASLTEFTKRNRGRPFGLLRGRRVRRVT
jgi:hypothetical protein